MAVIHKLGFLAQSIGDLAGKIKVVVNRLFDAGEGVGGLDGTEPGVVGKGGLGCEGVGDFLRNAPVG